MEVEIPRDRTATFVAVRIRPLKTGEDSAGNFCATVEDSDHVRARRDERRGGAYLRSQQSQETRYCFDRAFGPSATQQEVYEATTQEHVAALVNGELPALTVIAYGATGAGKTHTMMGEGSLRKGGAAGNESSAGIIPHSVGELFSGIEALRVGGDARHRSVRVSYLEVYNERVYDLLAPRPENGASKSLKVCEDEKLGIVKVLDLVEEKVSSAVAVLELMRRGNERRATESTGANDVSSRSHAVLQISLAVAGENGAQVLSMIDLAGSERASATGNRGPRLAEGAHINKSLLALANCINALTDATAPKPKFRDSKLTLLLKTALESQTVRLVVVACVESPACSYTDGARDSRLESGVETECTRLLECAIERVLY